MGCEHPLVTWIKRILLNLHPSRTKFAMVGKTIWFPARNDAQFELMRSHTWYEWAEEQGPSGKRVDFRVNECRFFVADLLTELFGDRN